MTFFYDLNKRLADLAAKQDAQQITETAKAVAPKSRLAESLDGHTKKYGVVVVGHNGGKPVKMFDKEADAKAYADKGIRVDGGLKQGSVRTIVAPKKKTEESNMDESAFQAAIGKKKYGEKGMKALQKAGREHASDKTMSNIRNKYDKYDESQGMTDEGNAFSGAVAKAKADGIQKGEKIKVGGKTYPVKEADVVGLEEEDLGEAVSRKHFQAIADTLRHIEDMSKRRELAQHHASAFKLANPRFDQARFYAAAGLEEGNAFTGQLAKTPKGGKFKLGNKEFTDTSEVDEGFADMDAWLKSREKEKGTGRFDSRKVSTGTVYTRKPETFAGDDEETSDAPRGRGRPKGKDKGPERVTAKAYKHKGERKANEGDNCCPHCGHEMVDEKAVSKKQQKFMGMVHAAQKGEMKEPSKEVGKVAKTMKKSDATDFAKTKHKGLPEKVKAKKTEGSKPDFLDVDKDGDKKEPMKKAAADKKEKKVDETTTSGSVSTAPAKATTSGGGMQFGKGVYESLDRQFTQALSESITVQESMDGMEDSAPSVTIQASGEEAIKLMALLKLAGLEGVAKEEECCPSCGATPCCCEQELDENDLDWPTNTETLAADPELRTYSGGLNGPKSTGQTTVPVVASQLRRQQSMEEGMKIESSLLNLFKKYK